MSWPSRRFFSFSRARACSDPGIGCDGSLTAFWSLSTHLPSTAPRHAGTQRAGIQEKKVVCLLPSKCSGVDHGQEVHIQTSSPPPLSGMAPQDTCGRLRVVPRHLPPVAALATRSLNSPKRQCPPQAFLGKPDQKQAQELAPSGESCTSAPAPRHQGQGPRGATAYQEGRPGSGVAGAAGHLRGTCSTSGSTAASLRSTGRSRRR